MSEKRGVLLFTLIVGHPVFGAAHMKAGSLLELFLLRRAKAFQKSFQLLHHQYANCHTPLVCFNFECIFTICQFVCLVGGGRELFRRNGLIYGLCMRVHHPFPFFGPPSSPLINLHTRMHKHPSSESHSNPNPASPTL